MLPWLLNAIRAAAPALAGYFINDLGDGLDKILPDSVKSKVKSDDGNFKWWFVAIILVVVGGVIAFVVSLVSKTMGKGKGKKGFFMLAIGGMLYMVDSYFGLGFGGGIVMATALVTLTTGATVTTTATLNFIPERIYFAAATQLSGIKISSRDNGVIWDADANGITHSGLLRIFGQVTNGYVITLANALIEQNQLFFEFTNSAAQTPIIYYESDSGVPSGEMKILQMGRTNLQIGGNIFRNFQALHLPNLAATDFVTMQYADGRVQSNQVRNDLQFKAGLTQVVVNTPVYTIDNLAGDIVSVNVNVGIAQTGYIQRWMDVNSVAGPVN